MNQDVLDLGSDFTEQEFVQACHEQPPQRLENFGASALSDTELLAMVLHGNGIRPMAAAQLAARLIAEAGTMGALLGWKLDDYRRLEGIGRIKGLQLVAIAEIARRMLMGSHTDRPMLNRADAIAAFMTPIAAGLPIEKFWVLCLDRKNRLKKRVEISSGTATAALAHPREVFRAAIRESATAIVCLHNHPSGDPSPSAPDLHVTRQLRDAARTVDVDLIDHVILGTVESDPSARGYFSFREAGLL